MPEFLMYAEISVNHVGKIHINDGSNRGYVNIKNSCGENIESIIPEARLEILNKLVDELMSRLNPEIEKLQAEINAKNVVEWL